MSLLIRRIIFYLLLAAFLISAPIIISYTAGYRWSFTQRRILKTGALTITSVPDKAAIALNHTPLPVSTPTLIRNLIPGLYDLEVTRPGYHRWIKSLPIESEQTTFALNIPLFKENSPRLTENAPSVTARAPDLPESFGQFSLYQDIQTSTIIVVNDHTQKRVGKFLATRALWRKKDTPLLFLFSAHEIWQFNPTDGSRVLLIRLQEPIQDLIPIEKSEAIILILADRVSAMELDLRDHQNIWDLATFDQIKTATLSADGEFLLITGTRDSQTGVWELGLQ